MPSKPRKNAANPKRSRPASPGAVHATPGEAQGNRVELIAAAMKTGNAGLVAKLRAELA